MKPKSRFTELSELERDFRSGTVSAEVAAKRAGQLVNAFKKDRTAFARAAMLWNAARAVVSMKNKRARHSLANNNFRDAGQNAPRPL